MKTQIQLTKGENKKVEVAWYHIVLIFTYIPAILLLLIASALVWLSDILLLDTHHFTFTAYPKWKK